VQSLRVTALKEKASIHELKKGMKELIKSALNRNTKNVKEKSIFRLQIRTYRRMPETDSSKMIN